VLFRSGRCRVRCFGWHNESPNQIPVDKLPWAHPIVPYGLKSVQPPTEGTMVFGFFSDGEEGQYPIIMGTVPGIPDEIRDISAGFSDPLSAADKRNAAMPRKIDTGASQLGKDTKGIRIADEDPSRYPKYLNEPTISRLARPVRGEKDGKFDGVTNESIANTTIDIQRKTRVTGIPTAAASQWDEAYPSYAAKFPYNNVTETESGHAFELDDTFGFERVQLSHRTGSTLEFANTGATKIKSTSSRQDITMGDQRTYVNGDKYETIDGDYYLQIGGKLRILAKSVEIVSGSGTAISAPQGISITGGQSVAITGLSASMSGVSTTVSGVKTQVSGEMSTTVSGAVTHILGNAAVVVKSPYGRAEHLISEEQGIKNLNTCTPNPIPDPLPNGPPPPSPVASLDFPAPNINF
jgi:hypothetical protein